MSPPQLGAAEKVLIGMLESRGLRTEVPADQLPEIVAWLGRNPRAMQAFVACLRDEPLDQLIGMDPETWDLKDQAAAPTLVTRLEQMFLARTIFRLDPASALLLESLGVYRKPFSIEAISSATSHGGTSLHAKEELASRFLLSRNQKWYRLNPVARQLAIARLEKDSRRVTAAHGRAADHFVKRVRADGPRALIRSGTEFVEARFHLLKSGRDDDFQNIAGDYRRLLLKNYQYLTDVPSTPEQVHQLVSVLLSALADQDDGYFKLRGVLARLLVQRDRPGDQVIALRQCTIATRGSRELAIWTLRAELTGRLDSASALIAVADQSLDRTPSSVASHVCCRVAELLAQGGHDGLALEVANRALDAVDTVHRQRLYTTACFILNRSGRSREAVSLLEHGYRELGKDVALRYRLFEEAVFIAFQSRDAEALSRIRSMIVVDGFNDHQPVLVDILSDQLEGKYRSAAERAQGHLAYFAVAAQASFCWLSVGEVSRAVECLDSGPYQVNTANAWLRALVAICQDAPDLYMQSMSDCIGRELSPQDLENRLLWIHAWDHVPPRLGIFPAFYFPVLPSGLTQLDHDIVRKLRGGSVLHASPVADTRLPRMSDGHQTAKPAAECSGDVPFLQRDPKGEFHFHIYPEERRVGDTYNLYGQTGAVGKHASAPNASFQQLAGMMSDPKALEELHQLLSALRKDPVSEGSLTAITHIEGALSASEAEDSAGMAQHLKGAGEWALKKAGEIGAGIAAVAIRRAMGLE